MNVVMRSYFILASVIVVEQTILSSPRPYFIQRIQGNININLKSIIENVSGEFTRFLFFSVLTLS